jgi:hypothetical protein
VAVKSGIKGSGTEGSQSFRDDGLKDQGRNFVAGLPGELRPLLVIDRGTEGGTVEMLLSSPGPLDPHQLDAAVIGQRFDVVAHLLHVLPDEPSYLGCTRLPFIEDLQSIHSDRMLNHKDDELIDASRPHRHISHDMETSSRYSISE